MLFHICRVVCEMHVRRTYVIVSCLMYEMKYCVFRICDKRAPDGGTPELLCHAYKAKSHLVLVN